jgi:hypothetical protein
MQQKEPQRKWGLVTLMQWVCFLGLITLVLTGCNPFVIAKPCPDLPPPKAELMALPPTIDLVPLEALPERTRLQLMKQSQPNFVDIATDGVPIMNRVWKGSKGLPRW